MSGGAGPSCLPRRSRTVPRWRPRRLSLRPAAGDVRQQVEPGASARRPAAAVAHSADEAEAEDEEEEAAPGESESGPEERAGPVAPGRRRPMRPSPRVAVQRSPERGASLGGFDVATDNSLFIQRTAADEVSCGLPYACASGGLSVTRRSTTTTSSSGRSGGGEIRTHGPLAGPTVFKTAPFDRSGTPPGLILSDRGDVLPGGAGLGPAGALGHGSLGHA